MAKRIIVTLASALAVMLVLVLLVSVLIEHGGIFGDAIKWLLVALVGILMATTLYFTITNLLDIFRKRDSDEELMDEASIEEILASESVRQKQTARMVAINLEKEKAPAREKAPAKEKPPAKPQRPARSPLRTPRKKPAEPPVEVRRQAAEVDEQLAEREARRRREMVEQQRVQNEAKADMIARAQEEARARARQAEEERQERDPRAQLAQVEEQLRASGSVQGRPEDTGDKTRVVPGFGPGTDTEDAADAERRKAAAIESARKQAEAAAAARRRAAQRAAQTQGFAPIVPGAMPGTGKVGETTVWPAATAKPAEAKQPETPAEDNIWNRMNVRQSARPVLSTELFAEQDKTIAVPDPSALREGKPQAQPAAGNTSQDTPDTAGDEGKAEKKWAPAKLPGAWQATGKTSIPGDMNYNSKLVTAPGRPPKTGQQAVPPPQDKPKVENEAATQATQQVPASQTAAPAGVKESLEAAKAPAKKGSTRSEQAERLASRGPVQKPAESVAPATAPIPAAAASGTKPKEAELTRQATVQGAVATAAAPSAQAPGAPAGENTPVPGYTPEPNDGLDSSEPKRSRGRPPKPKTEEELNAPKRPRGRPPKPKTEEELNAPKRPRGRPPKPKTEEELNAPKRPRGRPPKPKTEEELSAPKRPRGRPPKPKTEEELNAPKRPRGRPPKAPTEGSSPR